MKPGSPGRLSPLCCDARLKAKGVVSVNRLWVLKNSTFLEKSQNSGDPKCLEIREDRLQRILTQFHFRQFSEKEFFNSHRRLHSEPGTRPGRDRSLCYGDLTTIEEASG